GVGNCVEAGVGIGDRIVSISPHAQRAGLGMCGPYSVSTSRGVRKYSAEIAVCLDLHRTVAGENLEIRTIGKDSRHLVGSPIHRPPQSHILLALGCRRPGWVGQRNEAAGL